MLLLHALQNDLLDREACLQTCRRVEFRGLIRGRADLSAVGEMRIVVEARLVDEVGIALDVRIAARAQVAIHHVFPFAGDLRVADVADGEIRGNGVRIELHVQQRQHLIGSGLALRIERKQLGILLRKRGIA